MLAPRENLALFGHEEEKTFFLNAFHSGRFPHAWILGGNFGIGKATFAFHMARYIFSGRQDGNTSFSSQDSLCRRVTAQSYADLWTAGGENETEIGVERVRDLNSFLTQTSAEGGWRVLIIDGAERLNRNAANALLKRLEEPPSKTVFFLTTMLPARLLPTIQSRCHSLSLKPLEEGDMGKVLQSQGMDLPSFSSFAEGSPGRLMRLMEEDGPQIYADLQKIIEGTSPTDFINAYAGEDNSYDLIEDLLRNFLYKNLMKKLETRTGVDQALIAYEKIEHLFDQCRFSQLDKRATLNCVFSLFPLGIVPA
jgi:DNA polymerase III subunit delta'